ncbi:uncharacterized protein LOC100678032 isoform X2 [Nasonia vitripennis]|uniref:G-protein coupled receptors family 1 profile domain-containing protein n=1 Tax=Nasonia vitripennis TaxID=7425 RepID=A0A7M7LRA4_NASVI|nr:uncharacterized protein LOC100678032 isoform X2 [Nasonia vitripennis]
MGPWALGVPLVLVSALGLLLNAYVLLVVLGLGKQTQQQQTANTLLLIHLGAVEAAVCIVLLIFATGSWPAAGTWCVLHGFLLALLHPVALWTVTGLNCDRYYAIAAPLHYSALVSPRRVALGLAVSWTGALLLCLPPFSGLVPPYRYVPGLGCCAPDFGNGGWGSAGSLYGAIYAILGLALPALLVTVCNLRVLGIARYHRHRIASAIYEVTLSAQVTITHQRNPFFVPAVTAPAAGGPPRFHSAASTVMQLVGSLYLLYFPYCGLILWEACGSGGSSGMSSAGSVMGTGVGSGDGDVVGSPIPHPSRLHAHPRFASLASLLLACSPPINGLLYGLKSRTLRRSVQNYWRKKATKSELQQEIQARTPSAAGSRRPSGSGPTSSFFQFPPLQRRLSEALIALGNCRTGAAGPGIFGSGNIAGVFHRTRLQPAASCNTLRVPNAELERRWRHRSIESDSSTGSSDASVWTTGVQAAKPPRGSGNHKNSTNAGTMPEMWPGSGRRFTRVKTLEEGAAVFSAVNLVRPSNNSESSDTTTDTTTTTTANSSLLIKSASRGLHQERRGVAVEREEVVAKEDLASDCDEEDEDKEMRERGMPDGEEEQHQDRVTRSDSSSSWSCADDTVHSALDNSRGSTDDGLVIRPVGETAENEGQEPSRRSPPEKDTEPREEDESLHPVDRRPRRKSRIVRKAEATAEDQDQAASQLRPLLTSSS